MNDEELIKKYVSLDRQKEALEELHAGYPVQYIIGNVDFYDTIIKVNNNVLIPRFETEYLVDKTLKYIKALKLIEPKIIDIGTGSGCISIAIKKHITCEIEAIDINSKAITLAKENAKLNNVSVNFIVSDINNFKTNKKYDVIISNPPYVANNKKVEVKTKYEPQNAIFAPENGVYYYRIILEKLHNNLNDNHLIAFEIDDKEGILIKKLVNKYLPNDYIKIEKDYNNYERYVFISNKKFE